MDDVQGHEQKNDKNAEQRLVVVVSNNKQNKVVMIVPLSSKEVHDVKPTFQVPTYFQGKPGKARCEQVRAVDVERLLEEKQGNLTEMENADRKLMVVLDLAKYLGRPAESSRKINQ